MTTVITLQERLDFGAVTPLKTTILGHAGQDLEIDASQVSHMGTLCLQVLIAAANDWKQVGKTFQIISPSETCKTQLALHGFSPDTLTGVSPT
ncbi:STAS domain-containing protein [Profundibacter amoris]|uniref:STAS domain-containing protein n=1 Tax=Profundibacter amoris TaxID=2171755 RepID=A0A347UH14_9RHOB|nr:STAS domain-containing protein [Profundibacter amoris]AXX98142.1 STAS domain-containing protein [Profundibacter amoris]